MSLLALIAALSLGQFHPLTIPARISVWLQGYLRFFQSHFNAGEHQHGKIAWFLAVVPLLVAVLSGHWLLSLIHPFLAWLLDVTILYLIMGFQQFSAQYLAIQHALREERLDEAERLLSVWRGVHSAGSSAEEIARLSIEQALLVALDRVFGVIVWFVLFGAIGVAGSAGALLYRLALQLRAGWQDGRQADPFSDFSQQVCELLAWLPARMSAVTFAIVGNFEDTLYCWRSQAHNWTNAEEGVLLASAAGSLGVRLGMDINQGAQRLQRPELGLGDDADPEAMQSATGLIWRSVVLWLILLLMLSLANLVG